MDCTVIVYLTNTGLTLYRKDEKSLREELRLDDPKAAHPVLAEYFNCHGKEPVTVMVDVLEETHKLESVPHLNSRDRKSLLQRKIRQLFPGKHFTFCAVRAREKTGRRDDRVLFAAVTEDRLIDAWLGVLYELQIPIAAIDSLPIHSEKLVTLLSGLQHKLLISVTGNQDGLVLRQSYFNDNVLALSRFRLINQCSSSELVTEIKDEIDRTRRFIGRQYSLRTYEAIASHLFFSDSQTQKLLTSVNYDDVFIQPSFYGVQESATAAGVSLPENSGIAQLITYQFPGSGHYQEYKSRHYYNHYRAKKGLYLLSVLIFLSGAGYMGLGVSENLTVHDEIERLNINREEIALRLTKTEAAPSVNGFNPFEMQALLQAREQLQQKIIMPEALLDPVSHVLNVFPGIILTKIEWGEKTAFTATGSVDTHSGQDRYPDASFPAIAPVKILLQAKIEPFDGNYRRALAVIERLSERFRSTDGIRAVKTIKLPVDISVEKELSGATGEQAHNSEFILEMQWEPRQ